MDKFFTNELKYDPSNLDGIQKFLNHINIIAQSNPQLFISREIVYNELKDWNLKTSDRNNYGQPQSEEFLFDGWMNEFANIPGINVFRTLGFHYWCQFTNNANFNNYIKLYIPIDHDHLKEGVSRLFKFLASNNIKHESKVGSFVRSDNVIIRLEKGDTKSLNQIIKFISNDNYLQKGLNSVNPFLPTINGIGVMNETGISYNLEIANLISDYFQRHRNAKSISAVDFINDVKSKMYKSEVKETFDLATRDGEKKFATSNELNKNGALSLLQKQTLLNDALRATIKKYGLNQGIGALRKAILEGNYQSITNGSVGFRKLLNDYVSSEDIQNIIKSTLGLLPKEESLETMILNYCNLICNNEFIKCMDDMCNVTLNNYGSDFLLNSINGYLYTGNSSYFSRYKKGSDDKTNYRDYCSFITKDNMQFAMSSALKLRGINKKYNSVEELISEYVKVLQSSDYEKAIGRK